MADVANDTLTDEPTAVNPGADVEMAEGAEDDGAAERSELPFAGEETVVEPEPAEPARVPFIDYLTSPIVTLIVGAGDKETILTAHQALLVQSPHFHELCDSFTDDGSVRHRPPPLSPLKARHL